MKKTTANESLHRPDSLLFDLCIAKKLVHGNDFQFIREKNWKTRSELGSGYVSFQCFNE